MSGPLPGVPRPLTVPASWVYGLAVAARNRRFDRGAGVTRLAVPVISVGNLTAGGTGKTPMTVWICRRLAATGRRPMIAMRGYGARDGEGSDEAAEYAERIPGVEVVADPDRAGALRRRLRGGAAADCIVLDDGFQHRAVHRNLDLVLVDATRPALDDRLLPAGWLREPPASLRRADAVVVTRAEAVDDALAATIERSHGRPPLAWSRHAWTALAAFEPPAGAERSLDVDWLQGRRFVTMLGVGNPVAVIAQLERAGAEVLVNVPVRDHERYGRGHLRTARALCADADALLTTGKDWVKLRRLIEWPRWRTPVVVPHVELELWQGEADVVQRVKQAVGA